MILRRVLEMLAWSCLLVMDSTTRRTVLSGSQRHARMFKIGYPFKITVIPGQCSQHEGCTGYSVIPDNPNQHRYELHSAGPNIDTGGTITIEVLRALSE